MTSSNVFILLALLRTLTDGGKQSFVDSVTDETKKNSVLNLMLKQLINDLYILEVSKNSDDNNLEHVLHLYKKIYDPIKNEKTDLSIKEFANILSKLSFNFNQFFLWQDRIIKFYKWKNNKLTFFYLMLITFFLYKPALIIIIPLMYMIYFFLFGRHKFTQEKSLEITLKKDKYQLDLEPNVIYFIEFVFNLNDLQNMLSYITICVEKLDNFLKNPSNASKSLAKVSLYLLFVLLFGCSKFFIFQLWYHFLKKKLKIMNSIDQNLVEKKRKSFASSLINEIVKKEEVVQIYEIQELLTEQETEIAWQLAVYTKELILEPKLLEKGKVSLVISGYKNLNNLVANYEYNFKPGSKWSIDNNNWALSEEFYSKHDIFTFKHKYGDPDNLREFVYIKDNTYRIRRLSRKIIINKEHHLDHSCLQNPL